MYKYTSAPYKLSIFETTLSKIVLKIYTVFGFYLRLEDIARRAQKRKLAKMALEKSSANWMQEQQHQKIIKTNSNSEFINLAFEEEVIT